ncbi:MAG: 2-oxoacid:acceptor oxidoreductase subunit alpha [Actinobacteria bacterium]|nr:2-oxoacid:acceptor oxidoreductase subunit alpha [Actinomycetota bacterium]MCL6105400.1 2-oxoacid:acceptor oxidoreductase subunit alpha [Actinomycetota bacterium]
MTNVKTTNVKQLDKLILRFAGDSGDGMQLVGDRFSIESAIFGNDLVTLPDYPAEIRAPAGTLPGVSAFQIQIADHDILTPGDIPDALVAMNPAALKANFRNITSATTIIVNSDSFDERSLAKAGYSSNPLTDGSLAGYKVYEVPMTSLTVEASKDSGAKPRDAERAKNFFALGLVSWIYGRPTKDVLDWMTEHFASKPLVLEVNKRAFNAGYNFGETAELFESSYEIGPAKLPPGEYTQITGNTAIAWGLVVAADLSRLSLFLGSYPITPASDILHELAKHKNFGVRTFQAEDEISAVQAALGASFGGSLGVTTTSGPGLDLKAETIGLALSLELPLLVIDVQRAGPSTGMPTKPEQSDLLTACYGRHGEAPLPVLAAKTPTDCFDVVIEAVRIAIKYRTPVILLSDAYLANGSEPWRLPDLDGFDRIDPGFADSPNYEEADGRRVLYPYLRDADTLARPWVLPGTPGLEHRIGGLEKKEPSGEVSYDPINHALMTRIRRDKIAGIARDIPPVFVDDPDDGVGEGTQLLVLGWGSTYGAITTAAKRVRARGKKVAHAHLTYLNPFPSNLGDVLSKYSKVIVPECNLGQLTMMIRAKFLVDAHCISKVQGQPFKSSELERTIISVLDGQVQHGIDEDGVTR